MSDAHVCPHCEGRLLAGATVCLHCGQEVSPAAAAPAEAEGALGRFMFKAILFIAVLGGLAVLAVDLITEQLGQSIPEPTTVEVSPDDPNKICVAGDSDQIEKLVDAGAQEVGGPPGQRCFLKRTQ